MKRSSNLAGGSASAVRLSVGVVGAGTITQLMHLPVLRAIDELDIVWVADIDSKKVYDVGRAYGIKSVHMENPADLPACDLALLAIPTGARKILYEEFAQRGTAVFAEKMLALSPEEHRQVCSLFAQHRLGCGYMRRAYGTTKLLSQMVEAQWFGDLMAVKVYEGDRTTRTRVDSTYIDDLSLSGGGVLSAIGCHVLDTVFFITQSNEFEIVSQRSVMDSLIDRRFEARLSLCGNGTIRRRVDFKFCVSWLDRQSNTMEFEFERAVLTANTGPASTVQVCSKASKSTAALMSYLGRGASTANQAFYLEWEEFLRGLSTGVANAFSAEASTITADAVGALYTAAGRV